MALGHTEKNRHYVQTLISRLLQASDERNLFLEKKQYTVGEPIVLVVFLTFDNDQRPKGLLSLPDVVGCIERRDFAGIEGLSLGLVGGTIRAVNEKGVCANSWVSDPSAAHYHLDADATHCFHDYDDISLYTWYSPVEDAVEASLTEVDYALLLCLKKHDTLNQFLHSLIKGFVQICDYDEKEEMALMKQIQQIQKNTQQFALTSSVIH